MELPNFTVTVSSQPEASAPGHRQPIANVATAPSTTTARDAPQVKTPGEVSMITEPRPLVATIKPSAPLTQNLAINQAVDLLPLLDLVNDASTRDWQSFDGSILHPTQGISLLHLPVLLDGSYDLQVKIFRSGAANAFIVLPVGDTWGTLVMTVRPEHPCGLELIDGKAVGDPANPTRQRTC